jgi:hypothetical protein
MRRRALRTLASSPPAVRASLAVAVLLGLWFAASGAYQIARKPAELLLPVSGTLARSPDETWRRYAPSFRAHATDVMTSVLLAALAQVEGAGNPLARTRWRWRPTWHPFELYRPASSAVGMYQITDATFRDARRYCIRNHVVAEDGPWHDFDSCWFNKLYMRVVPSHAIEMTSAWLDRGVANTLARHRITGATLQQKQELAAVIHLCGVGAANGYARDGLRPKPEMRSGRQQGQRCGDHDVKGYLARVETARRLFVRYASAD